MSVQTVEVVRDYPVEVIREYPVVTPSYHTHTHTVTVEDNSYRYRSLIEAERKHFSAVEHEYNSFIHKMDIVHHDLELKLEDALRANFEMRRDNEILARRVTDLEYENGRKAETLKKYYHIHTFQAKRLDDLEFDNVDLRATADTTTGKSFKLHGDVQKLLAEIEHLEVRLANSEAHYRSEINRLNLLLTTKDQHILDRDREIERLRHFESLLRQKDIEIEHLKRFLEESRHVYKGPEIRHVNVVPPSSSDDEAVRRLKARLEEAYATIEELQSRKGQVEIIEKPKYIEKIIEKRVEVPVETVVEKYIERPVKSYPQEKTSPRSGKAPVDLERLLALAEKNFNRKLTPLYYTIWKLLFYISQLEANIKELQSHPAADVRAIKSAREVEHVKEAKPMMKSASAKAVAATIAKPTADNSLVSIYHETRKKIIDYLFEIFIRSANHAQAKKVNSLILFIINIKDLKETHHDLFISLTDTFLRLKAEVKSFCEKNHKTLQIEDTLYCGFTSRINSPVRSPDKRKTVDVEFRDMTNSWVQDTIESVKKRRKWDKIDPVQREYLCLFRLLAVKYRIVYPISGKPFEIDMDLAVKLEAKICKAFYRVMQIDDVDY